jgi:hypothetical protein
MQETQRAAQQAQGAAGLVKKTTQASLLLAMQALAPCCRQHLPAAQQA